MPSQVSDAILMMKPLPIFNRYGNPIKPTRIHSRSAGLLRRTVLHRLTRVLRPQSPTRYPERMGLACRLASDSFIRGHRRRGQKPTYMGMDDQARHQSPWGLGGSLLVFLL